MPVRSVGHGHGLSALTAGRGDTDPVSPPGYRLQRHGWDLALVAVLVAALVTSLTRLGSAPLWYDEIASVWASGLPWGGLRRLLGTTDANLGFYYLLLRGWRDLGDTAWLVRLPSAIAFVLTVVLTERIGRRLIGRRAALLAAGLLAIHPFAVAYARDARPYALVSAACMGGVLLGLRARERPGPWRLAAYAAVTMVAVALHLYAVLVVAVLWLALMPAGTRDRLRWTAAHLPVAVVSLVFLAVSLQQRGQLGWVPRLTLRGAIGGTTLLVGGTVPMVALLVAVVVLVRRPLDDRRSQRLLLGLAVLPLLALMGASLVAPTFVPRYLDAIVPVDCLVLAAGLTRARVAPGVRVAAGAVLVGALVSATVAQVAAPFHYEDYRSASQALLARARPGDGIVFSDTSTRMGMRFYLPLVRHAGQWIPRDVLAIPGAALVGFRTPQLVGAAAVRALQHHPRIWVVGHPTGSEAPVPVPGLRCAPSVSGSGLQVQLCRSAR